MGFNQTMPLWPVVNCPQENTLINSIKKSTLLIISRERSSIHKIPKYSSKSLFQNYCNICQKQPINTQQLIINNPLDPMVKFYIILVFMDLSEECLDIYIGITSKNIQLANFYTG